MPFSLYVMYGGPRFPIENADRQGFLDMIVPPSINQDIKNRKTIRGTRYADADQQWETFVEDICEYSGAMDKIVFCSALKKKSLLKKKRTFLSEKKCFMNYNADIIFVYKALGHLILRLD